MRNDGFEVLNVYADVNVFFHMKAVEVKAVNCDRGLKGLLQYLCSD